MSPKFLKHLYASLETRNITLLRQEKVIKPTDVDFGTKKFEVGPLTVHTMGEKNLEIKTDLLLWGEYCLCGIYSLFVERWIRFCLVEPFPF
jgi:hypothetical protein